MRVIKIVLGTSKPSRRTNMDAYSSETAHIDYCDSSAPVLVAASSDTAMLKAAQAITASGLRIGAKLKIEEAVGRIKAQPQATAVWVELDEDFRRGDGRADQPGESRRLPRILCCSRFFDGPVTGQGQRPHRRRQCGVDR